MPNSLRRNRPSIGVAACCHRKPLRISQKKFGHVGEAESRIGLACNVAGAQSRVAQPIAQRSNLSEQLRVSKRSQNNAGASTLRLGLAPRVADRVRRRTAQFADTNCEQSTARAEERKTQTGTAKTQIASSCSKRFTIKCSDWNGREVFTPVSSREASVCAVGHDAIECRQHVTVSAAQQNLFTASKANKKCVRRQDCATKQAKEMQLASM